MQNIVVRVLWKEKFPYLTTLVHHHYQGNLQVLNWFLPKKNKITKLEMYGAKGLSRKGGAKIYTKIDTQNTAFHLMHFKNHQRVHEKTLFLVSQVISILLGISQVVMGWGFFGSKICRTSFLNFQVQLWLLPSQFGLFFLNGTQQTLFCDSCSLKVVLSSALVVPGFISIIFSPSTEVDYTDYDFKIVIRIANFLHGFKKNTLPPPPWLHFRKRVLSKE